MLGTGTVVASAGREIVWVVVCIESGVDVVMDASSAAEAALDVFVAGEVEAGLRFWTGVEAGFGKKFWAGVEIEAGLRS